MSQEEIDETLHVAMTVGATRMQVMLKQEVTRSAPVPSEPGRSPEHGATLDDTAPAAPPGAGAPPATFKATEVVSQAGGG